MRSHKRIITQKTNMQKKKYNNSVFNIIIHICALIKQIKERIRTQTIYQKDRINIPQLQFYFSSVNYFCFFTMFFFYLVHTRSSFFFLYNLVYETFFVNHFLSEENQVLLCISYKLNYIKLRGYMIYPLIISEFVMIYGVRSFYHKVFKNYECHHIIWFCTYRYVSAMVGSVMKQLLQMLSTQEL